MYEYPPASTAPGTEMNVTPDMLAPIMATVTRNHDERRLPVKKAALSARRPVTHEMSSSRAK